MAVSKILFMAHCLHIGALAIKFPASYLLRNRIYSQLSIFLGLIFSGEKVKLRVLRFGYLKLESTIIWILEQRYIVPWVQIETFQFFVSP